MGDCTLSPRPMPSGSGLNLSHSSENSGSGLKRNQSSEDSDACPLLKICRLIESPERITDPGSETEFSFQEESTDLCCRSSSCSSSSERSERNAIGRVEFDIRSPEEGPNVSSTASDASFNDFRLSLQKKTELPDEAQLDDAGNSTSSGSSEGFFDPEIPRRDYWTCLQCSNINNRPAFRYCEKCYKVRRDLYQPRVKPRKKRKRKTKGTAQKANSERTTAFSGVKLELCSQKNRDSGVGCSQSSGLGCSQNSGLGCNQNMLGSILPDSDSTLSPDSGADTHDFHGIKLASTRSRSVALECSPSVDVIGTRQNSGRTLGAVQPYASQSPDEVDALWAPISQGVDEIDGVKAPASQGVDEVDALQAPISRDVDEVDGVEASVSQDIDEVDGVWPPASRAVDEVDCTQHSTSGGVGDVDLLQSGVRRDIARSHFTDCVRVDLTRSTLSQRSFDEVDFAASSRVDKIDLLPPPLSSAVNKRSVRTQTDLCYSSKSEVPKENPIVDVDKCMTCCQRALDGIFVHATYAHMCCCYKCTVKVWKTNKRCPLCNGRVMNVLRVFKSC